MKLEVINYTKKIKNRVVLDKINVSFESGKVYGLYGKNGSGKTTVLFIITSLFSTFELSRSRSSVIAKFMVKDKTNIKK